MYLIIRSIDTYNLIYYDNVQIHYSSFVLIEPIVNTPAGIAPKGQHIHKLIRS